MPARGARPQEETAAVSQERTIEGVRVRPHFSITRTAQSTSRRSLRAFSHSKTILMPSLMNSGPDLFWTMAVANVYRKSKRIAVAAEESREQHPVPRGPQHS